MITYKFFSKALLFDFIYPLLLIMACFVIMTFACKFMNKCVKKETSLAV